MKETVQIRLETPADYRQSEELMRAAFWNRYEPGCSEHYLVHILRTAPGFVPELDLVAVVDGVLAGQVVFVKGCIHGDDGRCREVLSLGPLAVLPSLQRKGIGRALIEQACTVARSLGYRAIFLCGDPDYYRKVGFVLAETFGIRTAENRYFAALHACPLYPGALDGAAGRYHEDPVYQVDEEQVQAFDRGFPKWERIEGTATQRRLQKLVALQRAPADL